VVCKGSSPIASRSGRLMVYFVNYKLSCVHICDFSLVFVRCIGVVSEVCK
jgi:hypothetical protein